MMMTGSYYMNELSLLFCLPINWHIFLFFFLLTFTFLYYTCRLLPQIQNAFCFVIVIGF